MPPGWRTDSREARCPMLSAKFVFRTAPLESWPKKRHLGRNFPTATGWLLARRREADDKETAP